MRSTCLKLLAYRNFPNMFVGCKNAANSGGEGALNRKDMEPPFFLYVTGGAADQGRWVG